MGALVVKKHLNEPLSLHCWNKLGGPAECLIDIETEDELVRVLSESHANQIPVRVLGLGSNLLVSDGGVSGVVIRLKGEFTNFSFDGKTMHAGAGADLRKVIPESVRRGLDGLWQLAGFPATIGGALAMNAGGRWGEISDTLSRCSGFLPDGTPYEQTVNECQFSYRRSQLRGIVTQATFQLRAEDPKQMRRRLKEVMAEKASTQPLGANSPSSGCAFRNPLIGEHRCSAGQLIDEAGGKGMRVGGASVSSEHANFIVTTPEATSGEVMDLMHQVQQLVAEHHKVNLIPEVVQWPNSKNH